MKRISYTGLSLMSGMLLLMGCSMLHFLDDGMSRPASRATATHVDKAGDRSRTGARLTPTWTRPDQTKASLSNESGPAPVTQPVIAVPPGEPASGAINSPLPTPPNSPLSTPVPPTSTPEPPTPTETYTLTPEPSRTPSPGITGTRTETPTRTITTTPTRTRAPTNTLTGTITKTPTRTGTVTITPTRTRTPGMPTPTRTPVTPWPTATPPSSPLPTPMPTSPGSPLATPTSCLFGC
jgi:hypothetical protein